jgi:DNA polymerase elongation subunit (family B)
MNDYICKITKSNKDYVIAVDTDSVYLNLNPIIQQISAKTKIENVTDFINQICEQKIQPEFKKEMELLASTLGCSENKIVFKREAIASAGMFIAKKRYALLVQDLEGVRFTEPKLKIMGLETARSSTPMVVRNKLKDCIKIILTKTPEELRSYVDEFYNEFMNLPIEDIASPRGIKGMQDYKDASAIYQKGTPIATKAALLHNAYIKKLGLDKEIPPIKENDKIKFVFTKVPNPYGMANRDTVIGFIGKPPKEFQLDKYTDKKKQFEKTFQEPLDNILQAIGWSIKQQVTLESFFI